MNSSLLNPNASAERRSADNILQRIREMGCASALIRDSTKLVSMCKASGIETVIYRAAGDDQAGNPLSQKPADFVLTRHNAAPDADFIHLTNEIGFPEGLVEWNEIAALTAESVGRRVVAVNPGTNAPVSDWRRVERHLKWLTERGHKVGVHLYLDGNTEHDAGGWAQLDYLKSIGVDVLITEFGLIENIEHDDVGWRKVLGADPQRYNVWMDTHAPKLASYGYPAYIFAVDQWRDDDFGKANGFGYEDKPEFTKHCAVINQKYPIQEKPMPDYTTHDFGTLIPKATVSLTQTINRRDTPSENGGVDGVPIGAIIGSLANGDVVGFYDKPFQNEHYLWYKIVYNGVACYAAKVSDLTFAVIEEPPIDPPAGDTREYAASDVDAMIADHEKAIAILRGAKLPGDGKWILDIPYVSQLGKDADSHNNDCLIADLLMIDRYLRKSKTGVEPDLPTVDMIVPVTPLAGNPGALLTFSDGILIAKRLGFKVEYQSGLKPDAIRKALDADNPVIALVDYAKYAPGNKSIPHFIVVKGYETYSEGISFVTNDPYLIGADNIVTADKLDAAMQTVPGNSGAYQALVLAAQLCYN